MAVEIGLIVLSIGASYLAGQLLKPKNKLPIADDKPTTLATRGSFLQRLIGRRRIAPLIGWAGDRGSHKEKVQGGKGGAFGSAKQEVWSESGWHQLCVGPALALHAIYQAGVKIFTGPITRLSHPSGSTIDLGKEGSFRIFWGQNGVASNQPINTFLGDASRVGVESSWPHCCYVEWRSKRLGSAPIWPLLEYEVEVRPQSTLLTGTPAYMEPTRTPNPGAAENIFAVTNGSPGTCLFTIQGTTSLVPLQGLRLAGNAAPDADFTVRKIEVYQVVLVPGTPPFIPDVVETRTDIYLNETLIGADTAGDITPYDELPDDGINAAHLLAELLFEPYPHGVSHDTSFYDIDSLEAVGQLVVDEEIQSTILARDGQEAEGMVAAIMQDLGVFLAFDPSTGLLKFMPVREPDGNTVNLDEGMEVGSLPELVTNLGPRKTDRLVFSFSDREFNYRTSTIPYDSDGQARREEVFRARPAEIASTVNFTAAATISERRGQEDNADAATCEITANRWARELIPGTPITIPDFPLVLRLIGVGPDPDSNDVRLKCLTDFYGVPASSFRQSPGNNGNGSVPAAPDLGFQIVEIPEYLAISEPQTVMVARLRAHATISTAQVHISRDNSTYTDVGNDIAKMTGGELTQALTTVGRQIIDQGPTFDALGPDISDVLDLSADETSWRSGRQLAVIGDEIFYLQKVTALGGSSYRLDGLIRARYDTQRGSHSVGAKVYIVENDEGLPIQDVLLAPQVLLYAKTQPIGNGTVPLAAVTPASEVLYGKGVRPISPRNLRLAQGQLGYENGADVVVKWSYFTPRSIGTGAGFSPAGVAVSVVPPEGDFFIEIMTALNVVVRSFSQATATYSYTAAQRSTDFSGEPTSFKVRVTQTRDGWSSDSLTQTFTRN